MIDEKTVKLAATVAACQAAIKKANDDMTAAMKAELARREAFLKTLDELNMVVHVAQGHLAKAGGARTEILREVDPLVLDAVEKGEIAERAHAERLRMAKGKHRDEIADFEQHPDASSLDKTESQKAIDELGLIVAQEETEAARLAKVTATARKALASAIDTVKRAVVEKK